jgi:UDP-glucose 4-epimerase
MASGRREANMRILVTGSSGWLGRTLVPRLRRDGHRVIGLDPVPAATTDVIGSIAQRETVRCAIGEQGIEAIIHAGALHKPNIATHTPADFVAVNIQGTLNLLEEAVAPGSTVGRFVMTSTTSLMISKEVRAGRDGGAREAAWMTEDLAPLRPRNIYGVTKYAAENLGRMYHELHGLPLVILRTGRFFPEADDMAHAIRQSDENTKANELLFRRATVEDMAEAHVAALVRAPDLRFDNFIIAPRTPFTRADCAELIVDAPAVVRRYFPHYPALYERLGWTMFQSIDRVYDATRAFERMGFACRTGFAEKLAALRIAPQVRRGG